MTVRIGLIHALAESMMPVERALAELWPEAEPAHLLDDSLYRDRAKGATVDVFDQRIASLLRHSAAAGAAGAIFTGSFFAASVERARAGLGIPVLTSYEALIAAALDTGPRLHILASAADAVGLLAEDIRRAAAARGVEVEISGGHVAGALDALTAGDRPRHDALVAESAAGVPACDALLLAQFTMAPARAACERVVSVPVLTAPDTAVLELKRRLS